eukprot:3428676-Pyramimonas_sp.AAC.1
MNTLEMTIDRRKSLSSGSATGQKGSFSRASNSKSAHKSPDGCYESIMSPMRGAWPACACYYHRSLIKE